MGEKSVAGNSQCLSRSWLEVLHQRQAGAARSTARKTTTRTKPSHGLDCLLRSRLRYLVRELDHVHFGLPTVNRRTRDQGHLSRDTATGIERIFADVAFLSAPRNPEYVRFMSWQAGEATSERGSDDAC